MLNIILKDSSTFRLQYVPYAVHGVVFPPVGKRLFIKIRQLFC
jgi:hypothetical protein